MLPLTRTIDALRRLAVAGLAESDPDTRAVAASLLAFVASDDGRSLDQHFGLTPEPTQAHWKTVRSRTERNIHLRLAAATFHPGLSPRHAASAIHAALVRYARDEWPSDRSAFETPPRLRGRIEAHLWAALIAWPSVLGERAIEAVLTGE